MPTTIQSTNNQPTPPAPLQPAPLPAPAQSAPVQSGPQYSSQKPQSILDTTLATLKGLVSGIRAPNSPDNVPGGVGMQAIKNAPHNTSIKQNAEQLADTLPLVGAVAPTALTDFFTEGLGVPANTAISAAGGGIGTFLDEAIHSLFDKKNEINPVDIGINTATSGAATAAAETIVPALLTKALSIFGSVSEPLIKQIWSDPTVLIEGYKGGFSAMDNLVREVSPKLEQAQVEGAQDYGEKLQAIAKIPAKGGQEALDGLMTNVENVLKTGKVGLEEGVDGNNLTFNRVTSMSTGDRITLQKAYDLVQRTVGTIGETTAENLDSTIQDMGGLRNFEGQPLGNDAKAIVGQIYHELNSYIQDYHPQLADIRNESVPAMAFFKEMGNIIPKPNELDNAAVKSASSKLLDILNPSNKTGNLATIKGGSDITVQGVVKQMPGLEDIIGKDVLPDIRGAIISTEQDTSKINSFGRNRVFAKVFRGISDSIIKAPLIVAGINTTTEAVVKGLFDAGVPEDVLRTATQYIVSQFTPKGTDSDTTKKPSGNKVYPNTPSRPPLKIPE